jgi:nitroreductase
VSNIAHNVDRYDAVMREYYANRKTSSKATSWSQQTAQAIQGKTRNHMLEFLRKKRFLQQ